MRNRFLPLLTVPVALAAQGQTRWYSAYEDGLAAQAKGDHRAALAAFQRAIQLRRLPGRGLITYGNNQVETYYPYLKLAASALAIGDLDQAAKALEQSGQTGIEPAAEREPLRQALERARAAAQPRPAAQPANPPPPRPLPEEPKPVPAPEPKPSEPTKEPQAPAPGPSGTGSSPAATQPAAPSPAGQPASRLDALAKRPPPPLPTGTVTRNARTTAAQPPQDPATPWLPWAIAGLGLAAWAAAILWTRRKKGRKLRTPYRIDMDSLSSLSDDQPTQCTPTSVSSGRITGAPERVGPYRITRVLGRGGCATTYLAVDENDGSEVALKIPHPHILTDGEFLTRFRREAALGALLDHPRIVRILDAGPQAGDPYLAMTFVRGVTLESYLRQHGALPVPEAIHIAWEVMDALAFAHAKSVVHRDLKPANVMLGEGGALVMDFGIARILDTSMTATNLFIGTPSYAAPEALVSARVGPAADRYALGIILYEMLTGGTPFVGETAFHVLEQHRSEPLPDLGTRCPGASPRLVRLVERLTMKRPEERPEDGEVVAILTELKAQFPLES